MAKGERHFEIYASGSTALVNASQNLFGTYQGLSLLAIDDVVRLDVYTLNDHSYRVAPSGLTQGVKVTPGASVVELLSMRVRNASTLIAHIDVASSNASAGWAAWVHLQ